MITLRMSDGKKYTTSKPCELLNIKKGTNMYRYDKPRARVDNRISVSKLFFGGLMFVGVYLALVVLTV